jgi:hypothetical protein
MKISIITLTGGRDLAFKLCESWMKKQTLKPDEWIVVDDYKIPTKCTMGQKVIRREPFWESGQMTLEKNLLEALKIVTGDIILIIEDDDWYSPNYIENMVKKIEALSEGKPIGSSSIIAGEGICLYYNITNYTYYYFNNTNYASLFQTAFTKDLIPQINDLLIKYDNHIYFDMHIWGELKQCNKTVFLTKSPWSIGIKGLRGKRSINTFGHDVKLSFLDEKYLYLLKKTIGEKDSNTYILISEFLNIKKYHDADRKLQSRTAKVDKNFKNLNFNCVNKS